MRIVFTLCSNNYLAQAKTLGDSVIEHNPGYEFVIGLVDRKRNNIDYDSFLPHKIIELETVGVQNFDELCERYDIIELNTAVKPFFFKFLFREHPDVRGAIYLDPDIMVFGSLESIYQDLNQYSLAITPHILSPIGFDGHRPEENVFLNFGIYNLGFIAVANLPEGLRFLEWWGERTLSLGYIRTQEGLFVDQLWINLATVFFQNVKVILNPGLNVAYWNLHERKLSRRGGTFVVNDSVPLVFYHFSSYKLQAPDISPYQNRYTFQDRPDVVELFDIYNTSLVANRHDFFSRIECDYVAQRSEYLTAQETNRAAERKQPLVLNQLKRITPDFIKNIVVLLNRKIESLRGY